LVIVLDVFYFSFVVRARARVHVFGVLCFPSPACAQILVLVTVVLPLLLVLQRGSAAEALCDALGFECAEKVRARSSAGKLQG
jgi:hypothetical protein